MTVCQAFGCSNKPNPRNDRSFFVIPDPKKRPDICKKWIHNIRNAKFDFKSFVPSKAFVVCEDHFERDCFEKNRQAELLGYKPRVKKLKPDAVPTVFSFRKNIQHRLHTERRRVSAEKREVGVYFSCHIFDFKNPLKNTMAPAVHVQSMSWQRTCTVHVLKIWTYILGSNLDFWYIVVSWCQLHIYC